MGGRRHIQQTFDWLSIRIGSHFLVKWFALVFTVGNKGHSKYESKPFDQKMTPYTEDGRKRYVNYRTKHKPLPCDRPSINTPEDIALSRYARGKGWKANFEYFMNREYAYNRDKGKCKCCGKFFSEMVPKHCHHVNPRLPVCLKTVPIPEHIVCIVAVRFLQTSAEQARRCL